MTVLLYWKEKFSKLPTITKEGKFTAKTIAIIKKPLRIQLNAPRNLLLLFNPYFRDLRPVLYTTKGSDVLLTSTISTTDNSKPNTTTG